MTSASPLGTYPLWVGSLAPVVTESNLKALFGSFGSISSAKIMRNPDGTSKQFGYVNFNAKDDAERAAKKWNNRSWLGTQIRTKGPSQLEKRAKNTGKLMSAVTKVDFRPFTDCIFFVNGKTCTPKTGKVSCRVSGKAGGRTRPHRP